MATGQGVGSAAAALLDAHLEGVLTAYEAALRGTDSASLREEGDVGRYLAEARQVLLHVVAELHRGTYLPQPTRAPGRTVPAAGRTHPADSERAATALFDAVAVVLLRTPEDERPSGAETAVLFSLLHRRIVSRHTARSVAHVGHLLRRVRSAHDDERRRIARELHDEVAGQLGSGLNWLELYDVYRESGEHVRAGERLESARDTVRGSLASLREIMTGLRDRVDAALLRAALAREAAQLGESGVEVRVGVTGDESALPAEVTEELFLLLREAQRNAARHAGATLVTVHVRVSPGGVRAVVEDDGAGFDARATVPRGRGGMLSMRERAELLGGGVTVESQPGQGTRVVVFVPLRGEPGGDDTGGQAAAPPDRG
ncbi:sensor histidine kinase [Streptomyces xiaopingdaonensis]|uniref:sensor histidine kinase n=1 Tax=Streptomyces xiaopingdaonensis TaxID=1565415 RepID=UPI00031D1916|nr:ATP-binding protein [Streptomyces xiaopingdaonensis]